MDDPARQLARAPGLAIARLDPLLRGVSRSFYWTIRVLPGAMRSQVGLAYLLARATDTIADAEIVAVEQRLAALESLRRRILHGGDAPLGLGELARHQGLRAERELLDRIEEVLAVLAEFEAADQERIRAVLALITSGQELDLKRFAGASATNIVALQSPADLDDYTFRVAGCVGEFWTRLCRAHLFPDAPLDEASLLANGTRFGQGLQLVNVLRDLPRDLRQGRCYLPAAGLAALALTPAALLDPATEPKLRPLYDEYLALASDHLTAGWAYTNALPRRCIRVRLACAWPILIGLRTIAQLRCANVLDPQQRIRVSRGQVRGLIVRSVLVYPFPPFWRRLFEMAKGDRGFRKVG
jgi:farnesyl-diphosphate farnesyltransferase